MTDAAVSTSRLRIGNSSLLSRHKALLKTTMGKADAALAQVVDSIKTSKAGSPFVAVGGGSPFVPPSLPGIIEAARPGHFEVANAIGTAVAKVGGQADRIVYFGVGNRQEVLAEVTDEPCGPDVVAGADQSTVEMVTLEETPLAYRTTPSVRVQATALVT